MNKKVCVVGLGYIGLPTAALLANRGYLVHGVDVNKQAVEVINRGDVHIIEAGLDTFVKSAVNSGNLVASESPCEADIYVIAVPTPFRGDHLAEIPSPDIGYVMDAAKAIVPFLKSGALVILESTSPVGTTDSICDYIKGVRPDLFQDEGCIHVSHCPERVLPGRIMVELVENDRIIGGVTKVATQATMEFYKSFVEGTLLSTDARTAEMAKLAENAYRDVNIAYANELSMICDKLNVDVGELIKLANHHPRVSILNPGPGVGGHCIAVDPWFIVSSAPEESRLIKMGRRVNIEKTAWVVEKIKAEAGDLSRSSAVDRVTVALMGLSFKPNIDDLRESPAVSIANSLRSCGVMDLLFVEPNLSHSDEFQLTSIRNAISDSDIVVYLVAHKEFLGIEHAGTPTLDFCGILSGELNDK